MFQQNHNNQHTWRPRTLGTFLTKNYSRNLELPVSDSQTLINSCSIESRKDPSPKSEVEHWTKFKDLLFNTSLGSRVE